MLKRERLSRITQMVNEKGIVSNALIAEDLGVSDMTVRRDLDELEKNGKLVRVHGGAQSLNYNIDFELSHTEKSTVSVDQKKAIARYAASLIRPHETVFLGPGTTIEMVASFIRDRDIRVVTNSLPAFEHLKEPLKEKAILIGGQYREHTGCFVGPVANGIAGAFNYSRAFISCNGIKDEDISTSSMEEGELQAMALNRARTTYLLADEHKFNREDFYTYYHLYNIDELITDDLVSQDVIAHYEEMTRIHQVRTDIEPEGEEENESDQRRDL